MATNMEQLGNDMLLQEAGERERLASTMKFSDVQRGKQGETVYLTAADLTLTSEHLRDLSSHYVIHADTVCLSGELKVPGRNITINARIISSDGEASIHTSGSAPRPEQDFKAGKGAEEGITADKPGKSGSDGADGQPGAPGQSAGHITLAAERFELNGSLSLIASGGNGGRGQDGGNGGKGANGTNGVDAERGFFFNDDPTAGGNAGNGGNGGHAGRSGDGGNGGNIFVGYVVSSREHLITMESRLGKAGESAVPGKAMDGGKGGIGGRELIVKPNHRGDWYTSELSNDHRASSGKDGSRGQDGKSADPASDGRPGICGISNDGSPAAIDYKHFYGGFEVIHRPADQTGRETGEQKSRKVVSFDQRLIGSLEQKSLTLHQASMAYLAASEDQVEEAAVLLAWLLQTTPDAAWFEELRTLEPDALDESQGVYGSQ